MHTTFEKSLAYVAHHHADGTSSRAAMELEPKGDTLLLRHNDFLHIHRAKDWVITALSGTVWVTQDGDVRDIVLAKGDSVTLDRTGRAILSAFGDASICIARERGRCNESRVYEGRVESGRVTRPAFA